MSSIVTTIFTIVAFFVCAFILTEWLVRKPDSERSDNSAQD